jgi:hypothetical protein
MTDLSISAPTVHRLDTIGGTLTELYGELEDLGLRFTEKDSWGGFDALSW